MEFCEFDEAYVDRLRAGDYRTQEHFVSYFSELIRVKLRSRVRYADVIEDLRQETFARVLSALRSEGGIRQPERLGVFVNSTCNHVLQEYYRSSSKTTSSGETGLPEPPDTRSDTFSQVMAGETRDQIQQVLAGLTARDRRLIQEILLEERDKDEVCREIGIDREYLRVLLHRARLAFKAKYVEQIQTRPAALTVERK